MKKFVALLLALLMAFSMVGCGESGSSGKATDVQLTDVCGNWVETTTGDSLTITVNEATFKHERSIGNSTSGKPSVSLSNGVLSAGSEGDFTVVMENGVPAKLEGTNKTFITEEAATVKGKMGEKVVIDNVAEITVNEITGFSPMIDASTYQPSETRGLGCDDGMLFMGISFSVKNLLKEPMRLDDNIAVCVNYDGYLFATDDKSYASYFTDGRSGCSSMSGGTVLSVAQLSEETFTVYIPVAEVISTDETTPLTIQFRVVNEDITARAAFTVR